MKLTNEQYSYLASCQHVGDGLAADISRYDNVVLEAAVSRRNSLGRCQRDGFRDPDKIFRCVLDTRQFWRIERLVWK
jgi:hypothetical protein